MGDETSLDSGCNDRLWRDKWVTAKAAEEQKSHNCTKMVFGSLSLPACFIVVIKTEQHVYPKVKMKARTQHIKQTALPKG